MIPPAFRTSCRSTKSGCFKLYGKVIIPEIVFEELAIIPSHAIGLGSLIGDDFIEIHSLKDTSLLLHRSDTNLDAGEKQAIAIAIELKAELLLMDEALGRSAAKTGIAYKGYFRRFS